MKVVALRSAADLQVSDMSANSPVGTTLAILERTVKDNVVLCKLASTAAMNEELQAC